MRNRIICAVLVTLIAFSAYSFGNANRTDTTTLSPTTTGQEYPYLAKRLFVENPNESRINFSGLRSSFREYFTQNRLEGSLYFEYLPTGTSIRINGDDRYRAASLIKLPVAMELFKAKELGRVDLKSTVKLKPEWLNDGFGSLHEKGVGYEVSLQELVERLLTDSDNTALRAIIETTDAVLDIENRALGALDIEFTLAQDNSIDIGTRSYSSFLKCLYFACFNTLEDSQTILQLLTNTPFDTRIAAGIDDSTVKIAHKIGVFNTQIQSDCGIVYLENKNYVLCIMLRGDDTEKTDQHFASLSRLAYNFLHQN